jgi:hypothetical protein
MFATFHCIAKRASTIRGIDPAGTALLAWPAWVSDLNRMRKLRASAFGRFDRLARSDLGKLSRSRWRGLVTAFGANWEQPISGMCFRSAPIPAVRREATEPLGAALSHLQ